MLSVPQYLTVVCVLVRERITVSPPSLGGGFTCVFTNIHIHSKLRKMKFTFYIQKYYMANPTPYLVRFYNVTRKRGKVYMYCGKNFLKIISICAKTRPDVPV